MYSICYVLTDDSALRYYNELLISVASLRKYNCNRRLIVLMDDDTQRIILEQCRFELNEFNVEMIAVESPAEYSKKEVSRYIKTNLRSYIKGDFLFLDTDTVVSDTLPDTISEADLAMVLDMHSELKNRTNLDSLIKINEKCGYTMRLDMLYYNSGVIWAKDTVRVRTFFAEWHNNWMLCRKKGVILDQPSMNYTNQAFQCIIEPLEGVYNVQVSTTPTPISLLLNARIIHYYNVVENGVYRLSDYGIQKLGYSSSIVNDIIEDPKTAFYPCKLIRLDGATERVLKSKSFDRLKRRYIKHPLYFRVLEKLLSYVEQLLPR